MNIYKYKWTTKILAIFMIFLFGKTMDAQDIHFSQIGNSPLNISPAMTAVFSGDVRAVANYKSQWQAVPVSFLTFSGSYEMKFLNKKLPHSQFGGGLVFNYDQAGHGDLSLSQLGVNLSYTHQMSQRNFLTGGFQISANQRMFKPEQLSFDDQFDGEIFNSDIGSAEVFDDPSFLYLNFSTGLNWHFQIPEKRTRVDIGAAVYNLNGARQSFFNMEESDLSRRFNLHGVGSFMASEKMDFMILSLVTLQQPYAEALVGFAAKYYLNQTMTKELTIQFGLNYRVRDAFIPTFEIEWKKMIRVGISYDVNTSNFTEATRGKGSPEFSVIYTLNKVKPLDEVKLCPLY